MDYGGGAAALASSDYATLSFPPFSSSNAAPEPNKDKFFGFSTLKQETTLATPEDDWKDFKIAKASAYFSSSKEMRHSSEAHHQEQMLSFSHSNSQMPSFPQYTSNAHSRVPGYSSEGLNSGIIHGMLPGMKGPFTPSQWMELEHQALIYKYITSNIQIPLPLLIPLQKSLDTAGFSSYPGLRYNTLGWGGYNFGFSSSTDPEPGRCRRTDGKKWRCAKDAVPNHKYCERHMNRGRHRSRKLVEAGGQPGLSVSKSVNGTSKLPLDTITAVSEPGNTASNSYSFTNQQVGNQPGGTNSSAAQRHAYDRSLEDKTNVSLRAAQDTGNVSRQPSTMSLKHQYSTTEQQNPREGTSRPDFGVLFSDSFLNPLNKSASQIHSTNVANVGNSNKSQHSLHLFREDWSRNRPKSSISDRTQLSISIPKTPSDYMSTTSSPNNEKFGSFPMRLLPEPDPTHMGLGIGTVDEHILGSWKTPVGGPLGEALHITTNAGSGDGKRSSALNLMMGGWDTNSPSVASSPTGVLQKAPFGSVSNSSARSSPESSRGGSICLGGLFGSTHLNSVFQGL